MWMDSGEYAYGDYSMIEAYVVASGFSGFRQSEVRDPGMLSTLYKGRRPAIPMYLVVRKGG